MEYGIKAYFAMEYGIMCIVLLVMEYKKSYWILNKTNFTKKYACILTKTACWGPCSPFMEYGIKAYFAMEYGIICIFFIDYGIQENLLNIE